MRQIRLLALAIILAFSSMALGAIPQHHSSSGSSTHKSSGKSAEKTLKAERKRQEKEDRQRLKAQQKALKEQEKRARSEHRSDYYINVNGHRVHRPMHADSFPDGAAGECKDGSFTFSEHKRGACSGHGGVRSWVRR